MAIGYVIPISAEFRKAHQRKSKKGKSFWVRGKQAPRTVGQSALQGAKIGALLNGTAAGLALSGKAAGKQIADTYGVSEKRGRAYGLIGGGIAGGIQGAVLGAGVGAGYRAIRNRMSRKKR
jgi:hypothetical protein